MTEESPEKKPLEASARIEALLFVATSPVTPAQISDCLGIGLADVENQLKILSSQYEGRGISIQHYGGKYQFTTSAEAAEDVLNYNFHPTQNMERNDDGSVTVTFKASGDKHIIWHLFKWGDSVKIITPRLSYKSSI